MTDSFRCNGIPLVASPGCVLWALTPVSPTSEGQHTDSEQENLREKVAVYGLWFYL